MYFLRTQPKKIEISTSNNNDNNNISVYKIEKKNVFSIYLYKKKKCNTKEQNKPNH